MYSDAYAAHRRQILGVGVVDVAIVRPTYQCFFMLERARRESDFWLSRELFRNERFYGRNWYPRGAPSRLLIEPISLLIQLQHTGLAQVRYPQTQRIEMAQKKMRWPRKWPNGPRRPRAKMVNWANGPSRPNGPMGSNGMDLVQSYISSNAKHYL